MTLNEISNGPDWIIWVVIVLLGVFGIVLLMGHGANLIAGYNALSEEKKAEYDKEKLCRVVGIGMLSITALLLLMALAGSVLPAWTVYVFLGVVILDCIVMIILASTWCKMK